MKPLTPDPQGMAMALHLALRDRLVDGLDPERTLEALGMYLEEATLVRHFTPSEIVQLSTHDGVVNRAPTPMIWANIVPTLNVAEWLRMKLGDKPIHVTSGYRSDAYNRAIGGSTNSLHKRFNALDLHAPHASPDEMAATLREHSDWDHISCGIYEDFCHVDTRALLGMDPWRADTRTDRAA